MLRVQIIRIAKNRELLKVIERVREEGIAAHVEQEGVPSILIMSGSKLGAYEQPDQSQHASDPDNDIDVALSLAGAWKDLDTDVIFNDVYDDR